MQTNCRGLFITGTNTEVGKTYVAVLITRALKAAGYRVGVYKPVASGCVVRQGELLSDDAVQLWEAAGKPADLERVCPQRFAAPLAPHLAAKQEGKEVDRKQIHQGLEYWTANFEIVIVEGAGGLMSPLAADQYNADFALETGFPLVVVAPNALGVINQTLQTLVTASYFRGGLKVGGVVLNDMARDANDMSTASNREELEARCEVPFLAHVHWQATSIDANVNWYELGQELCANN